MTASRTYFAGASGVPHPPYWGLDAGMGPKVCKTDVLRATDTRAECRHSNVAATLGGIDAGVRSGSRPRDAPSPEHGDGYVLQRVAHLLVVGHDGAHDVPE